MSYKVFIDDSGSKDYINPYLYEQVDNPLPFNKRNLNYWNNNYFVLCGVKIKSDDILEIDELFNTLKVKYFKTKNVEIKSVWLRNPAQREKHYVIPFKLNKDGLKGFGEEYFNLIWSLTEKIKIIGIVFDKRYFKYRSISQNDPLLRTTQIIFERIHKESGSGNSNIVIFDQMESDINVKKGKHGQILNLLLQNKEMKTVYISKYNIQELSFEKSYKSNFLQIADMCAYTINRQFMEHGREWTILGTGKTLPLYTYFRIIVCNFCRSNLGQVRGYGICLIPDKSKNNWNFSAGCKHKKSPH